MIPEQKYLLKTKKLVIHAIMWTGSNIDTLKQYISKYARVPVYLDIRLHAGRNYLVFSSTVINRARLRSYKAYSPAMFLVIDNFGVVRMQKSTYVETKAAGTWELHEI